MKSSTPISPPNARNDTSPLLVLFLLPGTLAGTPRILRLRAPSQYGVWIRRWASGTIPLV